MSDVQPIDVAPAPGPKKSSGYPRLQRRHGELVQAHETLQLEHRELLEAQETLQSDIDRLLEQHKRIMLTVKGPVGEPSPSWHQGANAILGQLENSPDRLALQTMTAAIAQLQSRLASIVLRTTL
jgi:hypothetical protein